MGYNKVILLGNLTDVPKRFGERTTGADFTLACNEVRYDDQGQKIDEVYFAGCKAFGRTAETLLTHGRKGAALLVEGKLTREQWTDKETGKQQSKTRILVRSFQFAGSRRTDDAPAPAPSSHDIPPREDEVPF